ncbi:MAG: hypothetical protein U0414_13595 [Polyangiaceae bacterium]
MRGASRPALRWYAFLALLLGAWFAGPGRARAWVDLKVSNDDIKVTVEPSGKATVEHRVTLLVSGGPLKSVTIKGVDADATIDPNGYVVLEKDASKGLADALHIDVVRQFAKNPNPGAEPDRTDLKIDLNEGVGIKRGAWILVVRYTTDLMASGALAEDGAGFLMKWRGPEWDDGLDATKATFVFPSAPTPPRAADLDDEAELSGGTVLSEVKRDKTTDTLELARAYAPKGERVEWTAHLDARPFQRHEAANAPPSRPVAATPNRFPPKAESIRDTGVLAAAAGVLLLITILGALKWYELRRLASDRGATPRALVPLPALLRAPLAGAALVGGVYLEMTRASGLEGALLVAVSALLLVHRSPVHRPALRGPGQWLSVRTEEALRAGPPPIARLDVSTLFGKLLFLSLLVGVGALAWFGWQRAHYQGVLVALDAAPLFAIFLTGRLDQLPPDPAAAPVGFFNRVVKGVAKRASTARIVPRVRVPEGSADADELRLLFMPAQATRGLRAIELAMTYAGGLGGYVAFPEILVRYQAQTDAEKAAAQHASNGRILRGRKFDERVLVIAPKLPTAHLTTELLLALLAAFSDRGPAPRERPRADDDATRPIRVRIAA